MKATRGGADREEEGRAVKAKAEGFLEANRVTRVKRGEERQGGRGRHTDDVIDSLTIDWLRIEWRGESHCCDGWTDGRTTAPFPPFNNEKGRVAAPLEKYQGEGNSGE